MKINKKKVYTWHSWLGLITGAFMILIGCSGSIAVFKHEIDWLVSPSLRIMEKGSPVSVDSLYTSLKESFPGGEIRSISFRKGPRSAHSAYVRDSSGQNYQAHIHPYTGAVTGIRPTGGYTWSLQNFIRQFHVRLLMGSWGRIFVGVFGVTLFLSCITGLYIYRNWIKTVFKWRFTIGWQYLISDVHKSVGLIALFFNLLIAATGAVLGLENLYYKTIHNWIGIPRERLVLPELPMTAPVKGISPLGYLQIAKARFPELIPESISFPSKEDQPVSIRGDLPAILVASGRSRVAIDPRDGSTIQTLDAREKGFGARLYDTFDPLHFGYFAQPLGTFLEYTVKVLWCLLGMTPGLLSISGFWLWYFRTRKRLVQSKKKTGPTELTVYSVANIRKEANKSDVMDQKNVSP